MESYILLLVIIVIVTFGLFFKMYPKFPPSERKEGFSSPSVAPNTPKCIQRSIDAQILLRLFPTCSDENRAPSEDDTDREELSLILMKLTCLDADATNSGVGGYNTLRLKYNTSHDAEPLTNFVGRCLNNGTKQRDIDIVVEKYDTRGKELIRKISSRLGMDSKEAQENYNSLIKSTARTLSTHCLAMRSSLDRPFGPRDPGFSTPYSVERLAPFS